MLVSGSVTCSFSLIELPLFAPNMTLARSYVRLLPLGAGKPSLWIIGGELNAQIGRIKNCQCIEISLVCV